MRPVTDLDVTELQEWLQLAGLRHIRKETVHDAVDLRDSERAFQDPGSPLEPRVGRARSA